MTFHCTNATLLNQGDMVPKSNLDYSPSLPQITFGGSLVVVGQRHFTALHYTDPQMSPIALGSSEKKEQISYKARAHKWMFLVPKRVGVNIVFVSSSTGGVETVLLLYRTHTKLEHCESS